MNEFDAPQNRILKILNEQRQTGQFCDVVIKLNNDFQVWAHFCVIAPQSDFIGNKYFVQEDMQFSIHNPMIIKVCTFACEECLRDVLDFMYCEDVTIFGAEHEDHVRHLGKLLSIQELNKVLNRHPDPSEPISVSTDNVAADKPDIILQVEGKHIVKHRNSGFQYKIQTQPALSKMHSCPGCAHRCYKPSEMLIHLKACKTTTNTKCPLCDKHFDTLTEFKGHLIRHDNAKPFYCNDCDVRFVTKTALNLHTPKHSTETPHTCVDCGKSFKWKHGLNSHMIVHAKEKKLLCDECGYSTSHLKTLRAHQLSHTGHAFRCTAPNCTYTSRRKENLKIHIGTHRNETPFVCEVCGHRFSQNKNLKRHAQLHISKNIHKCPHCSFGNYRTDKLKEHIRRQHTEKPLQLELPENVHSALDAEPPAAFGDAVTEAPNVKQRKPTVVAVKRKAKTAAIGKGTHKQRIMSGAGTRKLLELRPKPSVATNTSNTTIGILSSLIGK